MNFSGFWSVGMCLSVAVYFCLNLAQFLLNNLQTSEFNRSDPSDGCELSRTRHIFSCNTALCCSIAQLFLLCCGHSPLLVCWRAGEAV